MSISTDINQVQFIAEDFSTYQQQAQQFYQQYYPDTFNDVINTDLGNALIDQIAFAMMAMTFTINRRASENFMQTAKLNSSIVKLAKMLGYPISPAFPGTTNVTIAFPGAPYTFPITISQGFQLQGPGNIIYEYRSTTPTVIPAGSTSATIPMSEGVTKTVTYVSDGTQNQQFNIVGIPAGQYLYNDILNVSVDGVTWSFSSLLQYQSSNIFEILFVNSPPLLNFGDGIVGNIPPAGSQIILSYSYGYGLTGSIGSNQLSPLSTIVIQGQNITYTIANTVGNVGGNPEDIRHVKAFASSFFRTQNAAVIKSDYDTIAQLQNGVAIADAQIMRGVSGDITIQMNFNDIYSGVSAMEEAAAIMLTTNVSGINYLGVSGTTFLYVGGEDELSVSGTSTLGVSGTSALGWNGSFVTGIDQLGVSGISQLGISGTDTLFVGGESFLGVSGIDHLGVSGISQIQYLVSTGSSEIQGGVSGLSSYLSQVFSDTSKANNVQVVVLAVDANNNYIAPSLTLIDTVQQKLQSIADAVVTVNVVDGSSKIVPATLVINYGLSPTAVQSDVEQQMSVALSQSVNPFGLMVRRPVGLSLYLSDIQDSIRANTSSGDVIFIDPHITIPANLLDSDGNLIIAKQQVIQAFDIQFNMVRRFKRTDVFTGNS